MNSTICILPIKQPIKQHTTGIKVSNEINNRVLKLNGHGKNKQDPVI